MPPHEKNPTVARIEAIEDPVERAVAAQTFITNGRATLRQVEAVRTRAIRQVRATDRGITIDELAARMKAGRHIVVDALRGQKEPSNS
jgi:hypothetical protein